MARISTSDPAVARAVKMLVQCGYQPGSKRRGGAILRAAEAAGVSERTLHRWLKSEAFLTFLEAERSSVVKEIFDGLHSLATEERNLGALIFLGKVVAPHIYDDQFRRDAAKRKHEKEMAEAGLGTEERPLPVFLVSESAPGEQPERGGEDELH